MKRLLAVVIFCTGCATTNYIADGDVLIVNGGRYFCGSSPDALAEASGPLTRGDTAEVRRISRKTHSIALDQGDRIKVLDYGISKSKVLDIKSNRECWIESEVAQQAARVNH